MARYYRRHKHRMADINVVPYIDVMLVLLIIFMITSPLLIEGVNVNLPQASQSQRDELPPDKSDLIVVSIDGRGQVFLQNETEPVEAMTLIQRVRGLIQRNPAAKVVVKGDKQVLYGRVIDVIDVLKQAGVPQVALITRPVEKEREKNS